MKAIFRPSNLKGKVTAPPSKSMVHRYLICAALANGESRISNIERSNDINATIKCIEALGVHVEISGNEAVVCNNGKLSAEKTLPCDESGTTLRFMIPVCLLSGKEAILTGSERLLKRPLDVYRTLCDDCGFFFQNDGKFVRVCGKFDGGIFDIPGDVSSQFISGIMLVSAIAEKGCTISIKGKIESRPYIDMTMKAMADFGVVAEWRNETTICVSGGQTYKPRNVLVEGDYSNASFFDALNYVGHNVAVDGLSKESVQGDKVYKNLFDTLDVGFSSVSVADCPDTAPVLMALAAYRHGTCLTDTSRLKLKESNRGSAMAQELEKFGAKVQVSDNDIVIEKSVLHAPVNVLDGHNDHRVVMALSVLMTKFGGSIDGCDAVNKSCPKFFEMLKSLGANIEFE